jgi:hypothetical protein
MEPAKQAEQSGNGWIGDERRVDRVVAQPGDEGCPRDLFGLMSRVHQGNIGGSE